MLFTEMGRKLGLTENYRMLLVDCLTVTILLEHGLAI